MENADAVWQQELRQSLRTAESLREFGLIDDKDLPEYRQLLAKYRFALPRYYASLIDRADPDCPIRRQAIPDLVELRESPFLSADPLGDLHHRPAPRLTHRYRNRALIHLTPNCSMYCRYCFRKSLLNELSGELFRDTLDPPLGYLAEHPEIEEVIFSGGDPLLAAEATLEKAIVELAKLPHVKRLRFHTRCPVTLPSRITPALAKILVHHPLPTIIVVHFNHAKEVTESSRRACATLRETGAFVFNQSVLLKGVNDEARALAELSEALFSMGVLPYYLHHPDPAQGTGHFDISPATGMEIYRRLRETLPGYLVPKYVVDDGHTAFKKMVGE